MNPDQKANLDAALGDLLAAPPAPPDLRAALLAEARRQDGPRRRRAPRLLAAAALLLFVGGGAALVLRPPAPEPAATARGALKNFMEIHGLEFQGRDVCADTCTQWSRGRLGFEAPLPSACAGEAMRGGRACEVGGRPVAHYLLQDGRALYVFRDPIPGCGIQPGRALAVAGGLQAKAWNERGRGYVLVEQPLGPKGDEPGAPR